MSEDNGDIQDSQEHQNASNAAGEAREETPQQKYERDHRAWENRVQTVGAFSAGEEPKPPTTPAGEDPVPTSTTSGVTTLDSLEGDKNPEQ